MPWMNTTAGAPVPTDSYAIRRSSTDARRLVPATTPIAFPPNSLVTQSSEYNASLGSLGTRVKTSRRYRTALRAEQSQLTRGRILKSARRLFVHRGYSHVTMH